RLSVPGFVDISKTVAVVVYIAPDILDQVFDSVEDIAFVGDVLYNTAGDVYSDGIAIGIGEGICAITIVYHSRSVGIEYYIDTVFIRIRKGTVLVVCQSSHRFISLHQLLKIDHLGLTVFVKISELVAIVVHITAYVLNKFGDLVDDVFVLDDL